MKICMIESVHDEDTGSIGPYFVAEAVRSLGHTVDVIPFDSPRRHYDVELISVHHPASYPVFQQTPKHGKIRIVGGHVTYTDPRPLIPLSDVVCVGDGEVWIKDIIQKIDADRDYLKKVEHIEGAILPEFWSVGDILPHPNFIRPLLNNPPYLSKPGTYKAAWYVEIARGCPFSCSYCEVGNSMPYRLHKLDEIIETIKTLDTNQANKIVFFAPDEASYPKYGELVKVAKAHGMRQVVGLYRLDQIMRHDLQFEPNQLIKVGIDGLSERMRYQNKRRISNENIYDYFKLLTSRGHKFFKAYQLFSLPNETEDDFYEWEALMERVRAIPVRETVKFMIAWSPLIPRPKTPFANETPHYDTKVAKLIKNWHKRVAVPDSDPGWQIDFERMQGTKTYQKNVEMYSGNELSLIEGASYIHPAWRQ